MSKDYSTAKSDEKDQNKETSIDKRLSGSEDEQDSESESEEELDEEKVTAEITLRNYVSADYLDTLARYEFIGLRGKCLNWNRLQREGNVDNSNLLLSKIFFFSLDNICVS